MAGRKTENQNGLKYKIERKPQGNIEIPAVFAYDIVAASKKRLQSTKCKSASLRNKGKQGEPMTMKKSELLKLLFFLMKTAVRSLWQSIR